MFKTILSGYQAVVFDLDGTVLDNQKIWDDAIKKVLGKYIISEEPNWGHKGLPLLTLIEEIKSVNEISYDFKIDWAYTEINREYFKNFGDIEIRPGFIELAERLLKDEKRLVLASNSDKEIVNETLERLDFKKYFEFVLTRSDVKNPKPSPDIYLLAQKKLGVIPERILIFEDSFVGFMAAEEAKINSILVVDPEVYAGDFGSNTKVFVRDFFEVLDLMDEDYEDFFVSNL